MHIDSIATDRDPEGIAFDRVVFFTDAVWAIAITLLVIELRVPELHAYADTTTTMQALLHMLPKVVGYIVSFTILALFWIEHHRIFRYVKRVSPRLLWRNKVLLLVVALVPFPTAFFSEYHHNPIAVLIYAGMLALVGAAKLWLWVEAERCIPESVLTAEDRFVQTFLRRSCAIIAVCVLVMVLAALQIPSAYFGFGFAPLSAWWARRGF